VPLFFKGYHGHAQPVPLAPATPLASGDNTDKNWADGGLTLR